MKLIKVKIPSGRDVYINPYNISYICQDPLNDALIQIHLSTDSYAVKMTLMEIFKLLEVVDQ